jgi:hypothetical protein
MGGIQMPQPIRNWYFEPEPEPVRQYAAGSGDDDGVAPGLAYLPAAALQKHGARRLNPSDAPTIPGSRRDGWARTPSSTVYRARTLLIPADLLRDDAVVGAINAALAPVGMRIVLPDLDSRQLRSGGPVGDALGRLPRIAGLVPAVPAPGKPAVPVVIDAWTALQTLRAAAETGAATDKAAAEFDRTAAATVLNPAIVGRIGLEHLLVGSAVSPNAFCEGNDIEGSAAGTSAVGSSAISGTPFSEGNALTGPGSTGSYVYSDGQTRTPVALCLRAPDRL